MAVIISKLVGVDFAEAMVLMSVVSAVMAVLLLSTIISAARLLLRLALDYQMVPSGCQTSLHCNYEAPSRNASNAVSTSRRWGFLTLMSSNASSRSASSAAARMLVVS